MSCVCVTNNLYDGGGLNVLICVLENVIDI